MRLLATTIILLVSNSAFSQEFTATCGSEKAHEYRNGLDSSWKARGAKWSDARFSNSWHFEFNGRDILLLDGKPIEILHWDGTSLVALEHSSGTSAVSSWVYAFNLEVGDLVGSRVNSYNDTLGAGINALATNFVCDYRFD